MFCFSSGLYDLVGNDESLFLISSVGKRNDKVAYHHGAISFNYPKSGSIRKRILLFRCHTIEIEQKSTVFTDEKVELIFGRIWITDSNFCFSQMSGKTVSSRDSNAKLCEINIVFQLRK